MMKYDHHRQSFKSTYTLAETLNNFGCHHLQKDFYRKNNLNQMPEALLFYLVLLLILLLLLMRLYFYSNQQYQPTYQPTLFALSLH